MILQSYRAPWATDETDALADLTREFLAREATPNEERWAEQHAVDRDFWNKAGDHGLLCPSIPEEYGGGGGSFAHEAAVLTEQSYAFNDAWGFSIHSPIVAHYLNAYGSEEQKKKWLPGMASGDLVGAIAMTEPGTGSDLQAIRTRAVRSGDEYVINGSKTFISNATHCDLLVIVARTDDQPGGKGLSLIVAETKDLPGFERGPVLQKIGQHGQDTRELTFTDMRVPITNLLGETEGQGFIQLMSQLPQERLTLAVMAAASGQAAVKETIRYTKERSAFGSPLMSFQNTQFVLAECVADALAARTLVDQCVVAHLNDELTSADASMAKFWCSDMQNKVIDRCLQLFGGYGYMAEYPIARAFTGARVQKIYGGTNEIMKMLVARSL